jgi:hypothetical protein
MKRNLIHSTLIVGLALGLSIVSREAIGQDHPKSATTKASQSRGDSNAKDENIKNDRAPNDPNAKIEAPPEKGGPKTRQASCHVHIDNRTPYYAEIYTDGSYRGEISPWGDLTGYVGCGNTRFYARAFFRGGGMKVWGPSAYYVDGAFTWELTF